MTEVDWSEAPEGYPVWIESFLTSKVGKVGNGWHAECEDRWVNQAGAYWLKSAQDSGSYKVHRRPTTHPAAWNGEGLPPVGVTCWVHPHNTLWGFSSTAGHKRKILAYHTDFVWLGDDVRALEMTRIDKVDFSPIRTPEQIAADEREAYIKRMVDKCFYKAGESTRIDCEALYDAGLRFKDGN
jgi:hypothetical protein